MTWRVALLVVAFLGAHLLGPIIGGHPRLVVYIVEEGDR